MPEQHTPQRIKELDGVRGIAILLVLVYHYLVCTVHSAHGSVLAYIQKLGSLSWAGVDLFFVLSGYLIGGILIDNQKVTSYFAPFYLRRAARILPLYILLTLAVGAAPPLVANAEANEWLFANCPPLWTCLAFVQNIWMGLENTHGGNWLGVTWSLAIEEQAYLILPLVIRFISQRLLPFIMSALIISAPIFRVYVVAETSHPLGAYVWPQCRWDAIAAGVLVAWATRQKTWSPLFKSLLNHRYLILLLFLAGVFLLTVLGQGIGSYGMAVVGHTWLATGSAFLVLIAITPPPKAKRALSNPLLCWFGTVSYGIYLFHQPVSGLVHGLVRGSKPSIFTMFDLAVTLFALTVTLFLSAISWQYFESNLVKKARSLSYGPAPSPV